MKSHQFSYGRMGTKTRFVKEAKGKSEMAIRNIWERGKFFKEFLQSPTSYKLSLLCGVI